MGAEFEWHDGHARRHGEGGDETFRINRLEAARPLRRCWVDEADRQPLGGNTVWPSSRDTLQVVNAPRTGCSGALQAELPDSHFSEARSRREGFPTNADSQGLEFDKYGFDESKN